MSFRLRNIFRSLLDVDRKELLKVTLLTITFFLVIGAYTVVKELKDAVFVTIVGSDQEYQGYAKVFSMFFLLPALFFHATLVDAIRRHQLLYIYGFLFGITGIIFAFLLGHPVIGLPNTLSSPYRLFGWFFYFFVEGYSPLVVSVFWAFANSITSPQSVKNNYTMMIAGSKLGGMLTAGSAWLLLNARLFSDVVNLQILLAVSSCILMIVPPIVYLLITRVPHKDLHGYEAAYQVEKERSHKPAEQEPWFIKMLSGLSLLFKYPYVMGIFGMSFFFELINQVLKVENILFGRKLSSTLSEFTAFLIEQAFLVHLVGFFVVVFGTKAILGALGERKSLMLVPVLTGFSMIGFIIRPSKLTAVIAFVVTRSLNYAFAVPLRESLYIPTIKEIKFKTKSWIDGVGNKFAKICGSSFNIYAAGLTSQVLVATQTSFFIMSIFSWFVTAYLLGRRFEKSVKNNEVIGSSPAST